LPARVVEVRLFIKPTVYAPADPVQEFEPGCPAVFDHDDTYAPVPVPPLPVKVRAPGAVSVSVTVALEPPGLATE